MLMVIFGAGASHDSWSSARPNESPLDQHALRPPLAKQLFLSIPNFRDLSQRYPPCQVLLPYLESTENIEEVLERLREESESEPVRQRQLLAVQYYIRDVIRRCEGAWNGRTHGVSNYRTLLDQVRKHSEVCFVTFNYDTLMETALEGIGIKIPDIATYVSMPKYKLFKLHGSTDWERWVPAWKTTLNVNDPRPKEQDLLYSSPIFDDSSFVSKIGEPESNVLKTTRYYPFPALAIPTTSKTSFVCPNEHVQVLKEYLPRVTRIMIVGWRATEQNFLELLTASLPNPVRVMACCGDPKWSTETLDRLRVAGVEGTFLAALGGFTGFVRNHEAEWLLS